MVPRLWTKCENPCLRCCCSWSSARCWQTGEEQRLVVQARRTVAVGPLTYRMGRVDVCLREKTADGGAATVVQRAEASGCNRLKCSLSGDVYCR